MKYWVIKNGKRQHMESGIDLIVDGRIVCKKPSMYIRYLFEKEMLDLPRADITSDNTIKT